MQNALPVSMTMNRALDFLRKTPISGNESRDMSNVLGVVEQIANGQAFVVPAQEMEQYQQALRMQQESQQEPQKEAEEPAAYNCAPDAE